MIQLGRDTWLIAAIAFAVPALKKPGPVVGVVTFTAIPFWLEPGLVTPDGARSRQLARSGSAKIVACSY
jgi:hypothetical protein